MNSTSSLRDLYSPPSSAWSFFPPAAMPTPNTTASSSSVPTPGNYQWSTRPAPNSIFDLSPSLHLNEPSNINVPLLLKSLVASAFLQYTSTAIAMPLEVGKMLLQVQWVPKDASMAPEQVYDASVEEQVEDEEEEVFSDDSNENEAYFADPSNSAGKFHPPRMVDDNGYIMRTSVFEEGTRPEYVITLGNADGTWGMIKRIATFRGEGWLALWKGLLTSCIHDVISTNLQPVIDNVIQSLFFSASPAFQQPPLLLPIASHLITGFLLSPLDLVRTRLIVQSSMSRHKTYSGPIDALSDIIANEGGVKGLYLHPHLLIPTILDNTLRPLVHIMMPSLIASNLGLGPHVAVDTHPIAWGLAEFAGGCIGLLLTLPIETVRRRLQIQTRGSAKTIRTCVETRPVPYNGVVDALWHIVTEERSDSPARHGKRKVGKSDAKAKEKHDDVEEGGDEQSWRSHTGIGQLYRGLGMRLGASVIVFLLAAFGGREEVDAGWAEL
ncbi:hypothetical protein SERLADRAFT_458839 [Serpula lacrymans var. lacrymans S7.9]|uniref:Mitochondrial carrier n=1 Tax=Serpula lacrymans var. lacrymans (strain S7.9) TaxID=578457 RepID=F8NKH4_SERL9|nr:uncharacterized protein SERLADRAFT_458839 [Serpula lacrymans var. lacrymans S7.9]EGO28440.1 hypothetical protein SERLADRAFT_458839 [Serpula lacrymans var. lacrymans S7.9]